MQDNTRILEGKKHTFLGIALIFILYAVFLGLISLIQDFLKPIYFPNNEIVSFFVLFGLTISLLSLYWFLIVPKMGYPLKSRNFKEYLATIRFKRISNSVRKNIFLGVFCYIVVFSLCSFITIILGVYKFEIEAIIPPNSWSLIMAISPGVFEEIAFRGVILTMLLKKFKDSNDIQGEKKAWLISSALFGCAHLINLLGGNILVTLAQVFYACFMGLVLGALTLKSDSLIPAMLFHYLVDAFGPLLTNILPLDPVLYIIYGVLSAIIGMGPVPALICLKVIGWKPKKIEN